MRPTESTRQMDGPPARPDGCGVGQSFDGFDSTPASGAGALPSPPGGEAAPGLGTGWDPARVVPATVGFPAGETYPGFFFITGAHRSGTSWVTWLLNAHPQMVASMEAFFFGLDSNVSNWLGEKRFLEWATGTDPSLSWTKGMNPRDLARAARRALVESVLRMHWRPGIRLIGDKTPVQYLEKAALLHELFPEARLINCVRDGRDTAVSLAFHQLGHEYAAGFGSREEFDRRYRYWILGQGEPVGLFAEETLRAYASEWEWCTTKRNEAAAIFGAGFVDVRYEQLLADPVGVVRPLLEWLGVTSDEATARRCVETAAFEKITGRKRGQGTPRDFVRRGVQGDWVNYFTDKDKQQFKSAPAGKLLIGMGYARDEDW